MTPRAGALSLFCLIAGLLLALDPTSAHAQSGTIGLNFTGVTLADGRSFNGNVPYYPPDSDGAVGPNNIVELINGAYAVYDKTTGQQQQLTSASTFWSSAGVTIDPTDIYGLGVFNNRVLYDPVSQHWFAAAVTTDNVNNSLLVARSNTSNPADGWKAVSFVAGTPETGAFADFTRLGINADGIYIGVTNFTTGDSTGVDGDSLFSIPKADLLLAHPSLARMSSFIGVDTEVLGSVPQPIINFTGSGHAPVLGTLTSNNGAPVIYRADIVGGSAANAQIANGAFINTQSYLPPPNAAQPAGMRNIGTLDTRFGANAYQVGNIIYAAHSVGFGVNSAVEWFTINEATNVVIQQGLLSNANYDYFQPAIAVNAKGDVVMTFTRSGFGADGNLSEYAVIGKSIDGTITFGDPFLLVASLTGDFNPPTAVYPLLRWGDYMTLQVDPNNPNVFWAFGQYATDYQTWATQITQITVPEPSSVILSAFALAALLLAAWRRRSRHSAT